MGKVYPVLDRDLKRQVALKMIRAERRPASSSGASSRRRR